ncbi:MULTISPECIES: sodium-extruding oxaloacetate decarboxylase subunit alpha [Thiorhodovibrio]|uniref:sodium-extruding oxaloacetate decarboxylase subunit alpha n=1 Tax=Thiorhodovibrio TaxID=61593 RepID=UPI0019124DE4|nr:MULTISPECIES: sodium-extruding oxaloacetate decarboxylase subunit alpha [Thiorhodovibrio]MBK5969559.1 oxaloacetate decarboxylase subunit alpha [Thiorhodovibrio winogradskyi]WPL13942.1 Methylmalonyl-CoA carboxyltransferase 5S subunit [Thiorhodovibrio litoralis]
MNQNKALGITDVVLRDAHQSLLATRMRIDDMLPIAAKLDQVGFWSLESWGGATFDACIRYLGEDPWERLRKLKAAMPNTRQQMLLRAQNLLGYRHYADDVVDAFVERAVVNGIDVFRIFDAMNDIRNFERPVKAALATDAHAQGALSYTVSPVHNIDYWVDLARRLEDLGCHSIAIKDMAGLLRPYVAEELIGRLKETCSVPIGMQCHATTGLSTASILKAAEAGIDMVDSSISSMSMTYGHSPTESVVAIMQGTPRDTGLDINLLEEIAAYFREVRKKYARFEGALKGVDSRILVAQVPGGMLTNMENQLREQGATDRLDEVLAEIPKVREDLGYIALVTPTSQIVGSQAVLNVLMGERYKSITGETAGVLKGTYGSTPAPVNKDLQTRVLEGAKPVTCRPADLIEAELSKLTAELKKLAKERGIRLADAVVDDVITYAMFPQVGLKFLENRDNPDAFEVPPWELDQRDAAKAADSGAAASGAGGAGSISGPEAYRVEVNGKGYDVRVSPAGAVEHLAPASSAAAPAPAAGGEQHVVESPLAGNIVKVPVSVGQTVAAGDVVVVLEAMKMETEVRAPSAGKVIEIRAKDGDSVSLGAPLVVLG